MRFRMGGLSRASLWGEAGSRERERGEFRESRAGQGVPPRQGEGGEQGEQGRASPQIREAGLTEGVGGELGGHASLRLSGLEEPEDSSSGSRWKSLQSCWIM